MSVTIALWSGLARKRLAELNAAESSGAGPPLQRGGVPSERVATSRARLVSVAEFTSGGHTLLDGGEEGLWGLSVIACPEWARFGDGAYTLQEAVATRVLSGAEVVGCHFVMETAYQPLLFLSGCHAALLHAPHRLPLNRTV